MPLDKTKANDDPATESNYHDQAFSQRQCEKLDKER